MSKGIGRRKRLKSDRGQAGRYAVIVAGSSTLANSFRYDNWGKFGRTTGIRWHGVYGSGFSISTSNVRSLLGQWKIQAAFIRRW